MRISAVAAYTPNIYFSAKEKLTQGQKDILWGLDLAPHQLQDAIKRGLLDNATLDDIESKPVQDKLAKIKKKAVFDEDYNAYARGIESLIKRIDTTA